MKDYSVTVEISFSIEAPNEEKAQERAAEVVNSIQITHKPARWLGDPEIGEPTVEED